MVARVHDLRHERDRVAVRRVLDLHLGHVEAEFVEPAYPALYVVVLARRVDGPAGQLIPQAVVARADLHAELDRVHRGVQRPGGFQVEQLAADVHAGEVEVVVPLPGAELRMQVTGLGVHQIGGVGARVPSEERVGQRAVAPGEPGQVQADQEDGQGVHEAVHGGGSHGGLEHRAVRHRAAQMPGDQHRLQRGVLGVGAPGDHGERIDGGDAEPVQVAQQFVLAQRRALGELLHGDDLVTGPGVAHHVARYPARQRDQDLLRPLLQRQLPRQFEQERGVLRVRRADLQCHRCSVLAWSVIVTSP